VIDTMQLLLIDYEIKGAKMTLVPASVDTETGEMKGNYALWREGDRQIAGKQAFHRDGHLNVEVRPDRNADGTGPKTFCVVRFEVPKFAGGNNYQAVDLAGTKDAFEQTEQWLRDVGIKTNIKTAKPCRMDAFDNVAADEPYSCYQPVLSLLQGSRMKQRGYENGFLWENQSAEICAYDKRRHLLHKKESVQGLPRHPLRFEFRALKARKIRDAYGFNSVQDVLDGYDNIRGVYLQTMKKQLFHYDASDVEALFHSELVTDFRWYRENTGREWMSKYFRDYGIFCTMQKASMETVIGALNEVEENKMKRSRLKKKLGSLHFAAAALSLMPVSNRTHGELYNELQEKLLAA
jgi:hypothetical protein